MWNSLLHDDLAMSQKLSLALCDHRNKTDLTNNSDQLVFRFFSQHDFKQFQQFEPANFGKGGLTPMLDNQKKIILLMELPYLGENQRVVRRLFDQMSCFRMETYLRVLSYVQLQNSRFFTHAILSLKCVSILRVLHLEQQ